MGIGVAFDGGVETRESGDGRMRSGGLGWTWKCPCARRRGVVGMGVCLAGSLCLAWRCVPDGECGLRRPVPGGKLWPAEMGPVGSCG
ncbi:hypothetical protein Droror1_Dr00023659 [Drosera rotundifolia]